MFLTRKNSNMREKSHEVGGIIIEFSTRGTEFLDMIYGVAVSSVFFESRFLKVFWEWRHI
jgi:hypothetical protein